MNAISEPCAIGAARYQSEGLPAKVRIGLLGEAAGPDYAHLFELLAQLFPVHFIPVSSGGPAVWDASIAFGKDAQQTIVLAPLGRPAFVAVDGLAENSLNKSATIRFGDCPGLKPCLRGRSFAGENVGRAAPLNPSGSDHVAATMDGKPFWLRRVETGREMDILAALPPKLRPGEHLCGHLRAECCMGLLPLVHFLQGATRSLDWRCAAKRACFIIDDPSFYRPSYGYLDFKELAGNAVKHHYYASLATIPLDSWWQNKAALRVFQDNAPRLSVLLHGNDHLSRELVRNMPSELRVQRLAQALRRFERFHGHSGLEVCHVMEAPHGALSRPMLEAMIPLEYDAAIATPRLLIRYANASTWDGTMGMDLTNITLPGGFPVLPRIKIWGARHLATDVVLAAFLEQPILIVGHHVDFWQGYGLFEETAALINSFGDYEWASPKTIARLCYKQLHQNDQCRVRLYGRKTDLSVEPGVRKLWLHRAWTPNGPAETIRVAREGAEIWHSTSIDSVLGPIDVNPGDRLEISVSVQGALHCHSVPPPPPNFLAIARKCLQEFRDRSPVLRGRPVPAPVQEAWP